LSSGQPILVPRTLLDVEAPMVNLDAPPAASSSGLPKIVPSLARNIQRQAVLLGTALLTSPLDDTLDFAKYTRVWVRGAIDDLGTFDEVPSEDRAECTLPGVGQTYRAIAVENTFNLSFEMVRECSALVAQLPALEAAVVDAERVLADAMMLDPNSDDIDELDRQLAIAENELGDVEFELRALEQQMQYTRLVHLIYEHGVEL
ncbi:MAG: hypothetical protein AAFX94_17710, partial [Myxococcota bacterium]